ncbi:MAG TPA: transporter substrate-binding domain-containing protein [Burkholderiaceae bacterium]|nr:transporter substrate-binding domain-containing protein [Burkholderiaceae bacterium]
MAPALACTQSTCSADFLEGVATVKFLSSLALAWMLSLHPGAQAESYTCVSFDYPPLMQKGANGQPDGYAVELITRVFKNMGHVVTVHFYPWSRALLMARTGEADCIFTLYRSAEREQFLDFSRAVIARQAVYFYARQNFHAAFNGDLAAVKGIRIGVVRGINYGPKFEDARPSLQLDEASSIEQNFKKLAIGRVDLIPSNLSTASSFMARPELREFIGDIVRLAEPIEIVPSFIGFSKLKNLSALRDNFDDALRKFENSAEYQQLVEKYKLESSY